MKGDEFIWKGFFEIYWKLIGKIEMRDNEKN